MTDLDIIQPLITQVQRAHITSHAQGNERDVTTYITRPMWRLWQAATGQDPEADPTPWSSDIDDCMRVYGSKTVIIPGDQMIAFSV